MEVTSCQCQLSVRSKHGWVHFGEKEAGKKGNLSVMLQNLKHEARAANLPTDTGN